MDIEIIPITLAANQATRIERAGRYFEIIDAPYVVASLQFTDDAGSVAAFARNVEAGLYGSLPFKGFDVINGPNAQTIRLLVTDGSAGSRRQPGVVQVIDGGRARSLADNSGIGNVAQTPVAAVFPYVQLWNPAGSGRNIFVRKLLIATPTAGATSLFIRSHNVALATLDGSPVSKRNQAILTQFETRRDTNAALLGQGLVTSLLVPGAPFPYELQEPIMIGPGFGVLVTTGVVNSQVNAAFDFYHEPV